MTLLAITRSGARSPAELAPWMAGNIELVGISYGLASDAWMTNARVIATAIGRIRSFTNLRMVPMPPLADRRDPRLARAADVGEFGLADHVDRRPVLLRVGAAVDVIRQAELTNIRRKGQ